MARRSRKPATARRPPQQPPMDSRSTPDGPSPSAQRAQAASDAQTERNSDSHMNSTPADKPAPPAIVLSPGAVSERPTYASRAKQGLLKKDSSPSPVRALSPSAATSVASAASLVTTPPPTTPPAPPSALMSSQSEIVSEEALATPPAKPALPTLVSVEPSANVAVAPAATPTQASMLLSPVSPADSDGEGALVSSLSMPALSAASSRTSLMSVDELLSPRDSFGSPPAAATFLKFYRDRVEGDRTAANMSASESPKTVTATITVSLPTPKRAEFQISSRAPTPPEEVMLFASLNDPPAMDYSVYDQFDGTEPVYCPFPDDFLRHDSFYYQPRLTFEVATQLSRDPSPVAQQQQYYPPPHEQQAYAPQHNGAYGWDMPPYQQQQQQQQHQQQQQQWCYVPMPQLPPAGEMLVPPPAPYSTQVPDQGQFLQASAAAPPPPPPQAFAPVPMRQGSFPPPQPQQQPGPKPPLPQQQQRPPYNQQQHSQRPPYNRGSSSGSVGPGTGGGGGVPGNNGYGGRQWNSGGNGGGRGRGGRQYGHNNNNGGGGGGGGYRQREGGAWRDGHINGNRREDGERGGGYEGRGPRRDNPRNEGNSGPGPAQAQTAPPARER